MVRTRLWARAMIVFFVSAANDQALVLGAEDGLGSPLRRRRPRTEDNEQWGRLGGSYSSYLTGRLVVARTPGAPRGQARRGCEPMGIVADLDQNHGGADRVDARNGLEKTPSPGVGLHRRKEVTVQFGQLSFETAQGDLKYVVTTRLAERPAQCRARRASSAGFKRDMRALVAGCNPAPALYPQRPPQDAFIIRGDSSPS